MGERKLVEGRLVDIIDLQHLKEGHSPDRKLYVVEIKTGIDDVYEVRTLEQISPDSQGPINLFRTLEDAVENNRYLKKVGMSIPIEDYELAELIQELDNIEIPDPDLDEPTPDQIHAAIERTQQLGQHQPIPRPKYRSRKPKKAQ